MHPSAVLASLLCLATTQFAVPVEAIKATSLKLRSNPNVDLKLTKRDYITTTFRPNNETVFGFYVDVLVGTPPQFLSLAFSTSSTTWLPSPRNSNATEFCEDNATGNKFWSCYYNSFYQPNRSSTYNSKRGRLNNNYGTGLFATGTWGSDVFKINQLTIPDVSFGLATNFTSAAELGLGVDFSRTFSPYPSLPEIMATEGAINLILYSIYINDIRNDGGEIFFGAVDEAKYEGNLATFESNTVGRVNIKGVYWIDPDGVNSTLADSSDIFAKDVAEIQLGTPSLWVPNSVYRGIINAMPALTYSTAYEAYTVDCTVADSDLGSLQFDLGDTIISVSARQILVEYPTGSGTCIFTLYQSSKSRATSPDFLLGTPFLRSAFTVFDYTNNRTSVAQSVANSTSSTLREVPEGGIVAMGQRPGDPSSGTPTNTPTSTSSNGPNVSGSNGPSVSVIPAGNDDAGTPIAAIVGGSLGGAAALIIAGVLIWLFVTRKKKTVEPDMPFPPAQNFPPPPPGPHDVGPTDPNLTGYKPAMTTTATAQHTYGVVPLSQPPSATITSPPTSFHDNWGRPGFGAAGQSMSNPRPPSTVSGNSVEGYSQDLSSYGGNPGQLPGGQNANGMPSPPLNATGVYGNYGYSGYNQY
ncbi:hypothetical protein TWF225_003786 [Orbilia oligospora]|nr:hypothetical protein TWF225_003786 [Orbilia oligospora]KAF3254256.1 hypothetical protein TWF217_007218 [Orbilia oligospora]KAF3267720.1 hypothetical protein TWF128_009221 [Orbilia oligospora]